MRIEITATILACPGSCAIGVGAYNGGHSDYTLAYSPGAGAAVLKEPDATTGAKQLLTQSPVAKTDQVRFVFEVRGGGTKPTTLVGWVNGQELRATDAAGYDSFAAVGLWVGGDKAPVDVRWDNLKATRL